MFKTKITELLGIKYPIIQGGMLWISQSQLAAAVSNAGGLGIITSAQFKSGEELRKEILKTKSLTDQPFGVNLSLFPAVQAIPNDEFVEVIGQEKVKAVETSGVKSPAEYIPKLHAAGVKVIHKTATVRHAQKGVEAGADAVTIVGYENGGAVGMEDVTTMVLIPKALDTIKNVPVIAGGGIADARGFVAALALGAEGVVIGTRFMATQESPVHPKFKEWMLRAQENETVLVERSIRNTHRALKNKAGEELLALEAKGATFEELLSLIKGENYRRVMLDGDLDAGMAYCGQTVGLTNNIPTVREFIEGIITGAQVICKRLAQLGS
ncbi:MAG: nitronate monooxygenase family protein [Peptococcaceae bacterium]